MKTRGFTLVELLAVISIISLLSLITTTIISSSLKDAKQDLSDTQIKSIKLAAQAWGSDNIYSLPKKGECAYITLDDLISDGFLESKVINPTNKEEISTDLRIKITNEQNKKNISYEVDSKSTNNCTYIGNSVYVDLPKGFTPVLYDEGIDSWRVPKSNEEWYDYNEQKWANAVVLGKDKAKKAGAVVTVDGDNPDALMMFVYIPRYEYKIDGTYGKNGLDPEHPGEIEVNFIKKTQTTADNGYILHPAFTFGNKQLNGIWVGKFELSHTTLSSSFIGNNLECSTTNCETSVGFRILPNVSSLRYNDISNFWYGIKSIENTSSFGLSNIDIHMMKNSEWGAVAYLSQSKYGKYGNQDYTGTQKGIYINNSSAYYTGRSGGNTVGNTKAKDTYTDQTNTIQYSTYGFYTYDGYLLTYNTNDKSTTRDINKGTGASTTGNIYGVYDMNGGSWEYVMGAYGIDNNPSISASGFLSSPSVFTTGAINAKYYDVYANSTNSGDNDGSLSCKYGSEYGICFGHALSETREWYGNTSFMVDSNCSWFARSGYYDSANTNIFIYSCTDGLKNYNSSTRVVASVD